MAAVIGCAPEEVEGACREAEAETGQVVGPANYNAPEQTVIAGHAAAVEIACSRARRRGAKRVIPLPVSAPFHCSPMEPAAEKLGLVGEVPMSPGPCMISLTVRTENNFDCLTDNWVLAFSWASIEG